MKAHTSPEKALKSLPRHMSALHTGMESCVSAAGAIAEQIKILQDMADELEMASLVSRHKITKQTMKHIADEAIAKVERKLAGKQADLDHLKLDKKYLNETMKELDKFLRKAEKEYEDVQKDLDKAEYQAGGWATFGLVALTAITNPIVKTISHATDLIKDVPDLVGKFSSPSFGIHTRVESGNQEDSQHAAQDPNQGSQSAAIQAISAADEIVYQKIYEILSLVNNIQEIPTDEVDMDQYLAEVKRHQNEIQPARSRRSMAAMKVLSGCEKLLCDAVLTRFQKVLLEMRKSASTVNLNRTQAMTEEKQHWAKRMADVHNAVIELETWAQSQPGEAYGATTPLLSSIASRLVREDNSVDTNAILIRRQEELMRMRVLCAAAADNYQKKVDQKARNQADIKDVTRKLTRIQVERSSAKDIRAVLRSAGETLGRLKAQVEDLLRYFQNLSRIISRLENFGSNKFIETIRDRTDNLEIGQGFLFTEFQAQVIYTYLLVLRGHAAVVANSCNFYIEVSGKHLRPLSRAVSGLPLDPDDKGRQAALKKLEDDVEAASNTIIARGAQRISDIRAQIEEMGHAASSGQHDLPELPIARRLAIETSAKEISKELSKEIDANAVKGPAAQVDDNLPDLLRKYVTGMTMDRAFENYASYIGRPVSDLPTPALVISLPTVKRNIKSLYQHVEGLGIGFRPHVKTLKVLYGLPVYPGALRELIKLRQHVRILLMVDNEQQIDIIEKSGSQRWEIFIKLDVGSHRAGIAANSPELERLVARAEQSNAVNIHGFYCHAGHSYAGRSLSEAEETLNTEITSVLNAAALLPASRAVTVSIGATPTAHVIQNLKAKAPSNVKIELHAGVSTRSTFYGGGNFPCNDLQQLSTKLISENDQAIRVVTEVCGVYPQRNEALVNAGAIALSRETSGYPGFGRVVGRAPWSIVRLSQEHGILGTSDDVKVEDAFTIGQRVDLYCNHACITAAAFYVYFIVDENDTVREAWLPWKGW
ncbi:hypothetical protein HJFPF1_13241 [Paramyrothecium foliicola]|nr:hypothetical protein HJFPF1_13241 [Paramyrothecium foliicola]